MGAGGEKCSKPFSKYLKDKNLQTQSISELNAHDNKSKYSSNLKDIFKSPKEIFERLYTKETISTATEFLSKIPNRR